MGRAIELTDIHNIVLVLQNGGFVVVDIEVVRGTENCHNTRKTSCSGFAIHSISSVLCLMGANDR